MARPPVTIAALVGDDREVARAFVALLRDTLAPGDDVVLLGAGRDPRSPAAPRSLGGSELVGTAAALHERMVVVDARAVPVGPWLEPLVAALDDERVDAAAARTNIAAGDELLVGVPYRPHQSDVHRALVRRLAAERTGDRSPAECLSGPSLGLRRATFEAAGGLDVLLGPDPIAVLAGRVADGGRTLVVAEGSYLHHGGGPPPRPADPLGGARPFVSACLITKDEHHHLPRCLASIEGFADEVVVYDTGSSDDTREIAREHGAAVLEGYWDGDFARARNEALAACSGQWVLWMDADEALRCDDPAAGRRRLAELSSDVEGLIVHIDNLRSGGASTIVTHPACRLFRRAYGHWSGRLHEQVVARTGSPALAMAVAPRARITHWGYLDRSIDGRDKGRRNVHSALADLTGDGDLPWGTRLVSLGRSYGLAAQPEEALALCRAGLEAATGAATRRLALRSIIENLLVLDRAEEALAEVGRLRAMTEAPMPADTLEGRVLLALGRYPEALAVLERVTTGLDDDGHEHSPHGVAADKASALARLGRHDDAAEVLLAGLRSHGCMDLHLGVLVECLERADRPLHELADAVPPDRTEAFLGQLAGLDPAVADRLLEAWHEGRPSHAVLAAAATIAVRLPVDRRRAWSERVRTADVDLGCPLLGAVAAPGCPLPDQVLGAAVAAETFGDERGRAAFAALALQLTPAARRDLRPEVVRWAPSLLGVLDAFDRMGLGHPGDSTSFDGSTGRAAITGRSVLVVDRHPADLRTLAVSAALRRAGHEVTVLHPRPATSTHDLLAPLGITVVEWQATGPRRTAWERPLAAAVARRSAEGSFDAVVVARAATAITAEVRQLVPAARVVVDADDGPHPGSDEHAAPDLVLRSPPATCRSCTPTALVTASAADLFGPVRPVPEDLRTGICVVGSFGAAGQDELVRTERLITGIASAAPLRSVALLGDDPDGRIAGLLPRAMRLGPLADPRAWLRTARVVVVATITGADHWLAAAGLCGTPAVVVPDDADGLAQVAATVAALSDPDAVEQWQRALPTPPPSPELPGPDPLTSLPPARRRHRAVAGRSPSVVRWRGEARGCATEPLGDPPSLTAAGTSPGGGHPVVEVRRGWPPDLSPAAADRLVLELGWPHGGLPAEWLGPIRDVVDEVWVPTRWHRDRAVASGVAPSKVQVVPHGVDPEPFFPDGGRRRLTTAKRTKLLWVGEPGERDGLDVLLETYLTTFSAADDVCLVVRLAAAGREQDGSALEEMARRAADRGGRDRPAVELVAGPMTLDERADLYRSCDLLVQPHRALADPMAMLEPMAAGLPVALLDGGPGRELCDGRAGWMVRCRRVPVGPDDVRLTPSRAGFSALEPDRVSLATVLRQAAGSPEDRLRKGLAARDRVAGRRTLEHVAAVVTARLAALAGTVVEGRSSGPPSQEWVTTGR